MRFDEPEGQRSELALQQLVDGFQINFRGLGLHLTSDGSLACRVYTAWHPENLTLARAEEGFRIGRAILGELLGGSPPWASQLAGTKQTWQLLHDPGTGAILLCTQDDEGRIIGLE